MFAFLQRRLAAEPLTLNRVFGLSTDDWLLTDQLNRLTRQWLADHGLKPTSFGQLHTNLFGMHATDRARLNAHISERLYFIMLHDPMLSSAAGQMIRLLGTCERAANALPGGYWSEDIITITVEKGGSCNRCGGTLTYDHCKACGLVDKDVTQFSHARRI